MDSVLIDGSVDDFLKTALQVKLCNMYLFSLDAAIFMAVRLPLSMGTYLVIQFSSNIMASSK